MYLQKKIILKKDKSYFEEELAKKQEESERTLEDFKFTQSKVRQSNEIKNFSEER